MEGLDLDVLRPATFARLSEVLHAAHDGGQPYHVVHFDGHGTYLDVADLNRVSTSPYMYGFSLAAPARQGQHGYLVFEDPDSKENQQLADGPTLGKLLTQTGVPVLVLNACRSAYAEAREEPGEASGDVHARIRAYGSLAAEVADEGVPGVVAIRYNVYVVTAAQFVADLYAYLLAGRSLGQAATGARPDSDWHGRAICLLTLGRVASERFDDDRAAGEAQQVLLEHLHTALRNHRQALDLTPADDHEFRGKTEHQLGNIYRQAGDTRQALHHYQRSLQHMEACGNVYGAGLTRHNIAILLEAYGRTSDALHYARAALDNFQQAGPGTASDAADAEQLIRRLEEQSR